MANRATRRRAHHVEARIRSTVRSRHGRILMTFDVEANGITDQHNLDHFDEGEVIDIAAIVYRGKIDEDADWWIHIGACDPEHLLDFVRLGVNIYRPLDTHMKVAVWACCEHIAPHMIDAIPHFLWTDDQMNLIRDRCVNQGHWFVQFSAPRIGETQ